MSEYKDKINSAKEKYLETEKLLLCGAKGKAFTVIWFILTILYFRWVLSITY